MKASLSGYDLAFPLMTGVQGKAPGLFDSNNEILGTAFLLGAGYLLTAAHVAIALQASGVLPLLAVPRPGEEGLASVSIIDDIEILPHDIAILHVPVRGDPTTIEPVLPWFAGEITPFDDIWSIGFPYGLISRGNLQQFQLRVFRGHAVGNPANYELPTDRGRTTAVYELSFQAPRGLSGAPLLAGAQSPGFTIAGLVVGNSSQSMVVHTETEIDSSGEREVIVQRHESLHLGIAVQARQILELPSRLLGSTVGRHLAARGAVREAL
jgi:hypothetical protein